MEEPTITVKNKKTGEVKNLTVSQARSFGFDDVFIAKKLKGTQDLKAITNDLGGGQSVSNVEDILKRSSELPAVGEREGSRDAVLFAQEIQKSLERLNQAEQGGLPGASGPITNVLQNLAGKVGVDTPEAALKNQLANVVQLLRKQRTGVAFSPKEQAELEDIFGSLSTQEGPLKRKLEDLLYSATNAVSAKTNLKRDEVEKALSVEDTLTGKKVEDKPKKNIIDLLKGTSAYKFAQDVGAGAGMNKEKGTQESFNATLDMANRAEQKARETADPEQRDRLLQVAQQARETVGQESGKMAGKFSEDINDPYLNRSLKTATEIATTAELAGLAGKAPTIISSVGQKISKTAAGSKTVLKDTFSNVKKMLSPKYKNEILEVGRETVKKGSTLRETVLSKAADSGKKIDGNKRFKAVEAWAERAKRANPDKVLTIQKIIDRAKTFKGKKYNIDTAKKLWDDTESGFSSAKKLGKSVTQSYHKATRDFLRKQLDKVAPGFEKGTKLIAEGLDKEKKLGAIRKGLDVKDIKEGLQSPVVNAVKKYLLQPAGYLAGGYALSKLLGGKGNSYEGGGQ